MWLAKSVVNALTGAFSSINLKHCYTWRRALRARASLFCRPHV